MIRELIKDNDLPEEYDFDAVATKMRQLLRNK